MDTVFSLFYYECSKQATDLNKVIIGPQLFTYKNTAIERLYDYVKDRLTDGLEVVMKEYVEDHQLKYDPLTPFDYIENHVDMLELCEYFFDFMECDDMHAGFSITELPRSTFQEELNNADAIEIDGNFIRYFNVATPEDLADGDFEIYFDAQIVDNEFNNYKYDFSLENVKNATYDCGRKLWLIKGNEVKLFNIS